MVRYCFNKPFVRYGLMKNDKYIIGVNYWASHAGIRMWEEWDERVVEEDFKRFSQLGIEVVRMFPLWSAFQPIKQLYQWRKMPREIRYKESPVSADNEALFCGVDVVMMERFERALELADKYSLKVSVGILTGWMSGRMFVPEALLGLDLMSDPVALKWELAFVQCFVKHFKDNPAILSWSSGNETDCLADADIDRQWVWAQMMTNAIRAADPVHPISEDMHPLREFGTDSLYNRRGIHDFTTVHPYVGFMPFAGNEPADSMRGMLCYTAEAKAYADITGKPCLIEEIGNLGDVALGRELTANVMKTVMWTSLAEGGIGFAWWCAHEQSHLDYAPYDWCALERELGLFDTSLNPKPIGLALKRFAEEKNTLRIENLPQPLTDAVCILDGGANDWATVLGAYVLSKQAGVNIKFAHHESIPDAKVYFLPCIANGNPSKHIWDKLLERVNDGATLYISYASQYMGDFRAITGNEPICHHLSDEPMIADGLTFDVTDKIRFKACESKVLLADQNGEPLFTVNNYSKGKVFFLAAPLEQNFSRSKGGFDYKFSNIYKIVTNGALDHAVEKSAYCVGKTEHQTDNGRLVFATNYSPSKVSEKFVFNNGYYFDASLRGNIEKDGKCEIEPFETVIFKVKK